MTTDELITRARRAIDTGQPNLSMLYMRKAAQQVEAQRRQADPWRALRATVRAVYADLANMANAIRDALSEAARALLPPADASAPRADYVLAGPAK